MVHKLDILSQPFLRTPLVHGHAPNLRDNMNPCKPSQCRSFKGSPLLKGPLLRNPLVVSDVLLQVAIIDQLFGEDFQCLAIVGIVIDILVMVIVFI